MIRLARPRHWVKNLIVFAPLIFAFRVRDPQAWMHAAMTFAAFCLAASSMYVLNDLADRQRDRHHPAKRNRPLACGAIGPLAACVELMILALTALGVAWLVNPAVLVCIALYLLLQVAYSQFLKHKMILDVMCIAFGFILRAVAGGLAIPVEISYWLFVCTLTICMFMGFCKRFAEIATLDHAADVHRATLAGYSRELLTHLITLTGGIALLTFLLYTTSPRTLRHMGSFALAYTFPIAVYGVIRFAMLSMMGRYADPTELVLKDRPFQLTLLLWMVAAWLALHFGPAIREWGLIQFS